MCREAAMMPVRRLLGKLQSLSTAEGNREASSIPQNSRALRSKFSHEKLDVDAVLKADSVTVDDLRSALDSTKSSSGGTGSRYEEWQKEFGSD